ncbi:MAG: hypothetical protein ACI9J3_001823 [Parvicellaceae bacterium]|jgi:hypothetical protein
MNPVNSIKFMITNMKKILLIVALGIGIVSCGTSELDETYSGEWFVPDYTNLPPLGLKDTVKLLLSPGGGEEPYIETKYMGTDFKVVINAEGDTSRFVTHDTGFNTPEGYHVGSYWKNIPLAEQTEISKKQGYGYFLKLYSGWTLGFCAGSECTNEELSDESKVVWIQK